MPQKKIAILTPTFHCHSGIDRVAELQAAAYAKKGDEVTVIALESSIQNSGYRVITLGMPRRQFLQRLYRLFFCLDIAKMRSYKMLKGYDTVISHFYPMNWLAHYAKKKFPIQYIYYNHGINTDELNAGVLQKIYMRLFSFLNKITLRNVDEVISISTFLANEFYREIGIKSRVVYNEIDTQRFHPKVRAGNLRKKYGLAGKKVVLYVGRIAPHKNIHLLISCFKSVHKKLPQTALIIIGKPTFPSYFKKVQAMSDDSIIFAGTVSDLELPKYYALCDVYATASLWEGFNLPAAEAQACGKPVVAFSIGAHPEIVKHGQLIGKNDTAGFINALKKFLSK